MVEARAIKNPDAGTPAEASTLAATTAAHSDTATIRGTSGVASRSYWPEGTPDSP